MDLLIKLLLSFLVMYVLAVSLLYFFQHRLIFRQHTIPYVPQPEYADLEVMFQRDGADLHGWFYNAGKGKPLLIYYGGNAEDIAVNLPDLRDLDASFLMMNYRGFGKSTGFPSEKHLLQDALHILDEMMIREAIPLDHVILMGRSLGTGVASYVASQRDVGGVILVSPYDSLVNVAQRHYPFAPVRQMVKHKFESIVWAPEITSPALFIIAKNDRVVPNDHTEILLHAWQGPTEEVWLEGVTHGGMSDSVEYWRGVRDFVNDKNTS